MAEGLNRPRKLNPDENEVANLTEALEWGSKKVVLKNLQAQPNGTLITKDMSKFTIFKPDQVQRENKEIDSYNFVDNNGNRIISVTVQNSNDPEFPTNSSLLLFYDANNEGWAASEPVPVRTNS